MQAAQRSAWHKVRGAICRSVTMSARASRPPGRSTRAASLNTLRLSADRLTTPLEMTASNEPFSKGSSSGSTPPAVRHVVFDCMPAASPARLPKTFPAGWPRHELMLAGPGPHRLSEEAQPSWLAYRRVCSRLVRDWLLL